MRKVLIVLAGWLLAGAGYAGSDPTKLPQIEASMLVSGTLSVDAAGAVTGYVLDKPEKLPPPVTQLLEQTLPTFRFRPVEHDGKAQPVEAKMSLQVVANQIDPEHVGLRLRSALFTDTAETANAKGMEPTKSYIVQRPRFHYPKAALQAGVRGTVYLALRFDRTGHVVDVETRQVNLKLSDTPAQMDHWRAVLANAAMSDARKLVLHPPTVGRHANDAYLSGILPCTYVLTDMHVAGYGEWDSYVRGPKKDIAWLDEDEADADSDEAVPDGQFAMTGDGLRLLTPLGG